MLVQLASALGSAVAMLFHVRTARSAGANGYKPEQNADDGGLTSIHARLVGGKPIRVCGVACFL